MSGGISLLACAQKTRLAGTYWSSVGPRHYWHPWPGCSPDGGVLGTGGVPLLGISVFAVLGMPIDQLLRDRFSRFSVIHRLQASYLEEFQLLPTFRSPHFTVRLQQANAKELSRLLAALGAPILNPEYHEVSDDQREAG